MYLLLIQEYQSFIKPNRLKVIARGLTIVMLPVILYTDDTSGNKSKQWNKFDSWCVKLAGLPKKENSKLHNIHFVCCSNKVSVMDMSAPLASELQELEATGVDAYDAALQETVLVVAPVMCAICDNPRHSEIMNHLGPSAIKYCRICMVRYVNDMILNMHTDAHAKCMHMHIIIMQLLLLCMYVHS